jgi:thiol:disulfide interchange protein/DsbC/DsbD-like thiol-disulfide interchange protein
MARYWRHVAALLLGLAACAAAQALGLQPAVVTTEQVRAQLVVHAPEGVAPGKPVWLGLAIRHQPHWHTYWKNPGDSGLPTTLQWQLPEGVTAGEIAWPTPRRLPIGPLVNYGYEDELLLPTPLTIGAGFGAERLDVKLRADWLVCKEVCIPESGEFALSVPAASSSAGHAALFDAARRAQPGAAGSASAELRDGALELRVAGLPAAWAGKALEFFPETAGVIENAARPVTRWEGGDWVARIALSSLRSESPQRMDAVVVLPGQEAGVRTGFAITGAWPAAAAQPPALAPVAGAVAAPVAAPVGLAMALLLALLGGALLNLMPCVFPVLSLKVLGFAGHAHDRRALLGGGLAYTAGVVASFVGLAALLLVLRAGGEQLGWGFQLQSPGFVAALAALFTLIGLNLTGVFEFGSVLPSGAASLRARHPLVDSALTGVLAVAVASPCTAPFMGASLGAAATLPTAQALLVFAVLGLGMALPYLLASIWPALARALPRPGAWMAHFKVLMAFPMFATVVWLVWVLGQQVGIDGVAAMLGTLVAVSFVAWTLGSADLGRATRAAFGAVGALLLVATLAWMLPALHATASTTAPAGGAPGAPTDKHAAAWQPWSVQRVAELQAQGTPVFVDFTAAWCVTCQVNKRLVLTDATVLADFERRGVVLLRADWTRRDAAITAELARLGRNGVPVYAMYAPGASTPVVLSELLSVREVRDAIARL